MGLAEAATRKVGPLPAWGWGAVVVGGYVAYRLLRGGGGGGGAGVPSQGAVGDASGGGGGGGGGGGELAKALDKLAEAVGAIPGPGGSGGGGGSTVGAGGASGSGVTIPGTNFTIPLPIFTPSADSAALPSASSFFAWGDPRVLTEGNSGDTYTLAQQYYYVITHPEARSTNALFQRSDQELRNQLYGLVTGLAAGIRPGGSSGYDANGILSPYPPIPQAAYALAGVNQYTFGYVQKQYEDQGQTLYLPPELTSGTTWADLAIAIPKLQSYIYNLQQVKSPTAAQTTELATYRARLKDYQARYAAIVAPLETGAFVSGAPPAINDYGVVPSTGISAPSTAAPPVDYSKAIATLNGYIANLSAVKSPTTAQQTELATYKARVIEYAAR